MRNKLPALCLFLTLSVLSAVAARSLSQAAEASPTTSPPILALAGSVAVESRPNSMVLRCQGFQCSRYHELVFWGYDNRIHFLRADTLTTTASPLHTSPGISPILNERYLFHDRTWHQIYAVDKFGVGAWPNSWYRLEVRIIRGYDFAGSIPVNTQFNTPVLIDRYYPIDGAALRQPHINTGSVARIFVDNPVTGNVDIVTFHGHAPELAQTARISYRQPLACAGSPDYCSWKSNPGSSLAVDGGNHLYIADNNDPADRIVVRRDDGGVRPPIENVGALFDCFVNKAGIHMAPQENLLYLPAGCQSFENGAVAQLDITGQAAHRVIGLPWYDQGMLVDWYDQKRVFITTTDFRGDYDPDRYLYLHLLYDGQRIATLPLVRNYERNTVGAMVFDPHTNLLYVAVAGTIHMVRVNYGGSAGFPPLPEGELLLTPGSTDSLTATDSSAIFHFGATAVSQTAQVSYRELPPGAAAAPLFRESDSSATSRHTVRQFELTAINNATGVPLSAFESVYRLELHTSPREIGPVAGGRQALRLYHWNGGEWQQVGEISPGSSAYVLNIYTNLTGRFAISGPTHRVYLPTVLR